MNTLTEYTRTRSFFTTCLTDEGWQAVLGLADCYCELFLLEGLLLEGMEGLA